MKRAPPRRQRGFVMLIVLGLMATLALLGAQLSAASRTEDRIAGALRASAVAEAAADSAVHEVTMRLLRDAWPVSGLALPAPAIPWRVGAVPVSLRVTDESVKINPNYASAGMLRSLLTQAGAGESAAKALADAIVEWRQPAPMSASGDPKRMRYEQMGLAYAPSDRPFDSLDEVELVLGMTPRVFALIRPALSVYDIGDVKLDGAPPVVAEAVRAARILDPQAGTLGFPGPDQVVRIEATATPRGSRYTRIAVVRFKARPRAGEAPYQFLTWDIVRE